MQWGLEGVWLHRADSFDWQGPFGNAWRWCGQRQEWTTAWPWPVLDRWIPGHTGNRIGNRRWLLKNSKPVFSLAFLRLHRGLQMKIDMRRSTCRQCKRHFFMKDMLPGGNYCSQVCLERTGTKIIESRPRSARVARARTKTKYPRIELWGPAHKEKWLRLRYRAFRKYGNKCLVCGSIDRLHVDHIKPKSKYPELAFEISNLQILCSDCNLGKSNKFEDDWRS